MLTTLELLVRVLASIVTALLALPWWPLAARPLLVLVDGSMCRNTFERKEERGLVQISVIESVARVSQDLPAIPPFENSMTRTNKSACSEAASTCAALRDWMAKQPNVGEEPLTD